MSWIKMRTGLENDGRVRILSKKLRTDIDSALGKLFRFWKLADEQADKDGVLFGWTAEDVDEKMGVPGFCNALPSDWIDISGEWVKCPEYQEHNGSTGKARAVDQKRKSRDRADRSVRKVSDPKPDTNGTPSSLILSPLNTDQEEGVPTHPSGYLAPVLEGCTWFRATPDELLMAREHYQLQGYPANWFDCAVIEVESWLCGQSLEAQSARRLVSHASKLRTGWVIEKAQKLASLKPVKPGVSHASHKPFDGDKPRTRAEIEADERKAREIVEGLKVKIKKVA